MLKLIARIGLFSTPGTTQPAPVERMPHLRFLERHGDDGRPGMGDPSKPLGQIRVGLLQQFGRDVGRGRQDDGVEQLALVTHTDAPFSVRFSPKRGQPARRFG